ncbi:MAG: RagB/SusD family nutrient uptake outer membrane protein [Flavihumibacter sp.]
MYNASFWVTGDLRRSLLTVQQTTNGARYYFTYKYRDYQNRSDYAPIIRYAEVLLNVAEAYARTGENDKALNLLNAVRDRSVPAGDRFGSTAPADLVLAILQERRIEFLAEGRRWPDIHRLANDPQYGLAGIPAKIIVTQLQGSGADYDLDSRPTITPSFAAIPYSDFRFLWPIPSTEISANITLRDQQNPGD